MVTFDFDETLTRPLWNERYQLWEPSGRAIEKVVAELKGFHKNGEEARIVTSRPYSQEVFDFVNRHELPVRDVHFTGGELKGDLLLEIGAELHYDDSPEEAANNRQLGISTILVVYRFDFVSNLEVCEFKRFK